MADVMLALAAIIILPIIIYLAALYYYRLLKRTKEDLLEKKKLPVPCATCEKEICNCKDCVELEESLKLYKS